VGKQLALPTLFCETVELCLFETLETKSQPEALTQAGKSSARTVQVWKQKSRGDGKCTRQSWRETFLPALLTTCTSDGGLNGSGTLHTRCAQETACSLGQGESGCSGADRSLSPGQASLRPTTALTEHRSCLTVKKHCKLRRQEGLEGSSRACCTSC